MKPVWYSVFSIAAILLILGEQAHGQSCTPFPPHPLTNGTTANGSDVVADMDCLAPLASPSFTGDVGIGTTSPVSPLDVYQDVGGISPGSWEVNSALTIGTTGAAGTKYIFAGFDQTNNYGWIGAVIKGESYTTLALNPGGGNVGIGTTAPASPFDINMGSTPHFYVSPYGCGTTYAGVGFSSSFAGCTNYTLLGDGSNTFLNAPSGTIYFGIGNGYREYITSAGVGIGTASPAQPLQVVGTIRQSGCTTAGTLSVNSSGDIICTSDARLKNVLGDYRDGLSALSRISPQRFTYKATAKNPDEAFVHAGFIAQNVMTAIPEAVARQKDGYYSLDTTAVLAASVNAIKELKAANDRQAKEIAQLQTQMNELRHRTRLRTAAAGSP